MKNVQKSKIKKFIAFISVIAFSMALVACEVTLTTIPTAYVPPTPTPTVTSEMIDSGIVTKEGDGKFTLRYDSDYSFNPITGTSSINMAVASLMYKGLYVLKEDFSPEMQLAKSESVSDDGKLWTFTLREEMPMSDGSTLNASDAVYSITLARNSEKLKTRLDCISGASKIDDLTFQVSLKYANYQLPALLDFGLVKSGGSGKTPVGVGPYVINEDGTTLSAMYESAFYHFSMPDTIYLIEVADNKIVDAFSDLTLDVLELMGSDAETTHIRRDHEALDRASMTLMYIGIAPISSATRDAKFRQALSVSVGREKAAEQVFYGYAEPAYTPINPDSYLFTEDLLPNLEGGYLKQSAELFQQIGMFDDNSDLYLEYPVGGYYTVVNLRFIVNRSHAAELACAKIITQQLNNVGINVTLAELSEEVFEEDLSTGNYHIYIATTKVTPDHNFFPFFQSGGSLVNNGTLSDLMVAEQYKFLAAKTDEARATALREYCEAFTEQTPFIPYLYINKTTTLGRNAINFTRVSPSGLFRFADEWQFSDFSQEITETQTGEDAEAVKEDETDTGDADTQTTTTE